MKNLVFAVFLLLCGSISIVSAEYTRHAERYPVKSYFLTDYTTFNLSIDVADKKSEKWVRNPLMVTLKFLNISGYWFASIVQENNSAEDPRDATFTVVVDGYLDDSQRGSWYQVTLKVSKSGVWKISDSREAYLCGRHDSKKEFSKEPCP